MIPEPRISMIGIAEIFILFVVGLLFLLFVRRSKQRGRILMAPVVVGLVFLIGMLPILFFYLFSVRSVHRSPEVVYFDQAVIAPTAIPEPSPPPPPSPLFETPVKPQPIPTGDTNPEVKVLESTPDGDSEQPSSAEESNPSVSGLPAPTSEVPADSNSQESAAAANEQNNEDAAPEQPNEAVASPDTSPAEAETPEVPAENNGIDASVPASESNDDQAGQSDLENNGPVEPNPVLPEAVATDTSAEFWGTSKIWQADDPNLPAWIKSPTNEVSTSNGVEMRVMVGPFSTLEECNERIDGELASRVQEYLNKNVGGNGASLRVPSVYIQQRMVKSREVIERKVEFGVAGVASMYELHCLLRIDLQTHLELEQMWARHLRAYRLPWLGVLATTILSSLSALYAGLRLDTATKGYYTGRLRVATGALVTSLLGLGGWMLTEMTWL